MNNTNRIRIAALSTALFLGGVAAGGFAINSVNGASDPKTVTVKPRTQVIHQTKVRTVHVKPKKRKAAQATAPSAVAATAQVVPSPTIQDATNVAKEVVSRISSTGSGGGEDHEDSGEHESGEHEGGGDD